jgi:hypothetical protein
MFFRVSTLIVTVVSAFDMMLRRPMRMSPGRKQTVGQVQQDCTEGDEFEVLA